MGAAIRSAGAAIRPATPDAAIGSAPTRPRQRTGRPAAEERARQVATTLRLADADAERDERSRGHSGRGRRRGGATAVEAWELLTELMSRTQRPRLIALCSEFDITPPQLMTLRGLSSDAPVPMSEIAKALSCDASNVTGIVDRLEARGLVQRSSSPGDRRVKMLTLTPAGRAAREQLVRRMTQPPEPLAGLSMADQRALRDILRRALR